MTANIRNKQDEATVREAVKAWENGDAFVFENIIAANKDLSAQIFKAVFGQDECPSNDGC